MSSGTRSIMFLPTTSDCTRPACISGDDRYSSSVPSQRARNETKPNGAAVNPTPSGVAIAPAALHVSEIGTSTGELERPRVGTRPTDEEAVSRTLVRPPQSVWLSKRADRFPSPSPNCGSLPVNDGDRRGAMKELASSGRGGHEFLERVRWRRSEGGAEQAVLGGRPVEEKRRHPVPTVASQSGSPDRVRSVDLAESRAGFPARCRRRGCGRFRFLPRSSSPRTMAGTSRRWPVEHRVSGVRGGGQPRALSPEPRSVSVISSTRTVGRPSRSYPACLTQHPLTDWDDAAGCFGNRDEHVRHHETTCRVLPTQQRLEPDHLAGLQFDDRLIDKVELLIGQMLRRGRTPGPVARPRLPASRDRRPPRSTCRSSLPDTW